MQKIVGLVRRCVDDYHMIEAGDKIAVGVSGGSVRVAALRHKSIGENRNTGAHPAADCPPSPARLANANANATQHQEEFKCLKECTRSPSTN